MLAIEITEITFWYGINPPENRDVFQSLVTKFNQENPDIKLEALSIGQPDAQLPKILAAIVSNQPPDILGYMPQIIGKIAQLGSLFPLDSWLENSPRKSEIDPAMFDSLRILKLAYSGNKLLNRH